MGWKGRDPLGDAASGTGSGGIAASLFNGVTLVGRTAVRACSSALCGLTLAPGAVAPELGASSLLSRTLDSGSCVCRDVRQWRGWACKRNSCHKSLVLLNCNAGAQSLCAQCITDV